MRAGGWHERHACGHCGTRTMKPHEAAKEALFPATSCHGNDCAFVTSKPPLSPAPCRKTRTGQRLAEAAECRHFVGRKSSNLRPPSLSCTRVPRAASASWSDGAARASKEPSSIVLVVVGAAFVRSAFDRTCWRLGGLKRTTQCSGLNERRDSLKGTRHGVRAGKGSQKLHAHPSPPSMHHGPCAQLSQART